MKKRAVFFSTDALIALTIILLTILIAYPAVKYSKHESEIQSDVITVLSSLKIGEINDPYVQELIDSGQITDLNKTILEQIGEFYVVDLDTAKQLSQSVLNHLDTTENIGIWYGFALLASSNSTPIEEAENIDVERQIISGIKEGGNISAFSARAYLSKAARTSYYYFGGYVGDGNLSINVNYDGNITDMAFEIAINDEFDLYINSIHSGHYDKSPSEFQPAIYDDASYEQNFHSGSNTVEFKSNTSNLYIAGGYLKITYESSSAYESPTKYYFPGVEGMINMYDGFYIPGTLNNLEIFLHLDTPYPAFLNIGGTTVYNDSTSGEQSVTISNNELESLLDYPSLSYQTTPIRLGVENVSYTTNATVAQADVFSVTDLSGSMKDYCVFSNWLCCLFRFGCTNPATCATCGGIWTGKISIAKQANTEFINSVLNYSGNQVGLVGYTNSAPDSTYHELSTDNESLISEVNSWTAFGTTCICCGINRAVNDLTVYSNETRFRSVVLMSDGEANFQCAQQGTGDASQDAIQAACDAFDNYGIITHTVGFGSGADVATLQAIAECGNGTYYDSSDLEDIVGIYQQIAQEIIEASYTEQTIEVTGDILTKLYPDSYIEFTYLSEETPYGFATTFEKQFDDEYSVVFTLPQASQISETKAISYSGPRWTSSVEINSTSVYDINNYGQEYIHIGDPYSVNIPNSLIQEDNSVTLLTAISPEETSPGSQYNKIIYTVLRNMTAYSPISAHAKGCIWHIEFEDGENMTALIPVTYTGTDECYYSAGSPPEIDAIQRATYNLLELLDLDSDNKIDVKFSQQDLQIDISAIQGIPYTWATEVHIRRWY